MRFVNILSHRESSILQEKDHREIMQNLSMPLFFQKECQIKIEHVPSPSAFFKITDPFVGRSYLLCSQDWISGTNKNRIV